MDIFKKTIKYSKPSIEIDNKIKDLNEGLKKTKSTLSEQKFSEEEVDEILSEQIVDVENWKEIFDENTVSEYEKQIDEIRDRHNDLIKVQGSIEYVKNKEVKEIFSELYQGEVERVVDTYVSKYSNDIIDLREDLFHEIKKKPVVDLRVLEEKINLLTLKYNQLSEGLLNEPSTGLEDPVTFDHLKNHYQLLVGRLQEQLSTLGGGGEVRLQYLDDIVGIATNAAAYDGKFLKYNHSLKKFEFVTVTGGSGIGLTDLSVTTNSAGTAALSYNNNGVFTYTPPSFVGYATEGYVNNAVVGFITTGALSGYATEGYVNNAVAGVSTFSGNYDDLSNKPTIPTNLGDLTNNVGFITSGSLSGLASEAFVGLATTGLASEAFVGLATTGLASEAFVGLSIVGLTTEARTNSLQSQINALGTNLNIIGFYDAVVGVVTSLTVIGETRGYISVGNTLPSVGITTGDYLIISTGGGDVGIASYINPGISTAYPGDWIVGVGNSEWNILSYSQQVIAPRATNADFANTLKSNSSVNTSGIITASSFFGSGVNLSGVITSLVGYATEGYVNNAVTGITYVENAGIATIATYTSEWTLGANGSSDYTFTGPGLTGAENDPKIYLVKGQQYKFTNNMGAHPFRIQSTPNGSTGTQYNDGIVNNDVSNGTLTWNVQFDSPSVLYYQCTAHSNMGGQIIIGDDDSNLSIQTLEVSGISTFNGNIIGDGDTNISGINSVTATAFYGDLNGSITDATNLTGGGRCDASTLNITGIATISSGRIQADASSNLRFGNVASGSGSGRNIAIGDQVLGSLSSGNGRNIGIGELSFNNAQSGSYNIGVGIKAGEKITSGDYNVVLGGYDGNSGNLDIRTLSNRVVIADGEGNIRQYIDSEGKVGINTTVITETLTVAGIVSATSFYGTVPSSQLSGALPAIDGSALINVTGTGSGVVIKNNTSPVGTAGTIDFGSGLDVSFASGIATVTSSGISTANINADTLNVSGIATFNNFLRLPSGTFANNQIQLGNAQEFTLQYNSAVQKGIIQVFGNDIDIRAETIKLQPNSGADGVTVNDNSSVELYYAGGKRFETTGVGVTVFGTTQTQQLNVTGVATATSFYGSAVGLTSIPAGQLTGNLPAIDGSALLNVNATGDGVVVENGGSNVGSAKTINFDTGLDVTYSSGIATVTASGGSLQSRTTVSASTGSIADNAVGLVTVTGFKSYALMKVGLSTEGWIRIYTDSASRTADSSRSVGIDPAPGSGVIAEVVTTGISTEQKISPFTMGGNMDDPVDTTIYMSITNLSGSTQAINANLTILQLEA